MTVNEAKRVSKHIKFRVKVEGSRTKACNRLKKWPQAFTAPLSRGRVCFSFPGNWLL